MAKALSQLAEAKYLVFHGEWGFAEVLGVEVWFEGVWGLLFLYGQGKRQSQWEI